MSLLVVPVYAAMLALLFVVLSLNVVNGRRSGRVSLGYVANSDLERRVRVHANFAEYVPFALLLLAMAEVRGAWPALLHVLCLGLVIGRLAHAWGVSRPSADFRFRVGGLAATIGVMICTALVILVEAL